MEHVTPLALDHVGADPFVAGDFSPGDLLGVVMGIQREYWLAHPAEAERIAAVVERAARLLADREGTDEITTHPRALMTARPWHVA